MNTNPKEKRLSIAFGPATTALLDTGLCAGSTLARRLDILAKRFTQILDSTKAPTWPLDTWLLYLGAAQEADLGQPGAPWAIQGNARATGQTKLAYALDSLTVPQHILLLTLAERFGHQAPNADTVGAFLQDAGIAFSAAV